MTPTDLSQLRAPHLPPAISLWPLAPGWYMLFFLTLGGLCLSVWLLKRWRQKRFTLKQWQRLISQWQDDPCPHTLAALNTFMRRLVMRKHGRATLASLHDEAWLNFLDRSINDHAFSQGVGRVLAHGPYQQKATWSIDTDTVTAISRLTSQWVKGQL